MFKYLVLFFRIAWTSFETYRETTELKERVAQKSISLLLHAGNESGFKSQMNIYFTQLQKILDTKETVLNNGIDLLDNADIETTNDESELSLFVVLFENYCEGLVTSIKNDMVQCDVLGTIKIALNTQNIPYDISEIKPKLNDFHQKFIELITDDKKAYNDNQSGVLKMKKRIEELRTG